MSLSNILRENNLELHAESIVLGGSSSSLNDYQEGEFNVTWTTTNDANTGTFTFKYVKVGKLLTLIIKNGNFVITTPGQVQFDIPEVMYPAKPTTGFDIVTLPMMYLQAAGNYTRKLDMVITINGPEFNDPDPPRAYIQPADIFNVVPNPSTFAAGSYVLQQMSYTYLAAN